MRTLTLLSAALATALATALGVGFLAPVPPAAARESERPAVTAWVYDTARPALIRRNAEALSSVGVVGVSIGADGARVGRPTAAALRVLRVAHRRGLTAELLVSNYSNRLGDFDPRAAHRLLSDPRRIAGVARRLAAYAERGGWDGINVDLERIRPRDAAGLVRLVRRLQAAMPPERTVSVDVSAATTLGGYRRLGYDLPGLAAHADVIRLMTYDQHGPTWSGPGPIGGLPWQRRALRAALRVVPAERLDLGFGGYGYTWPRRGTGRTVTVAAARRLAARDGVRARWAPRAAEWTARLRDGTVVWWSDGRSYRHRRALAARHGVHGLAVWRLGSADTLR